MPRPSSSLISRDSIITAALAIVDADGAGALSTRRLAAELGVSGPSLYHHFAAKDEIISGMVGKLYEQIVLSASAPDWKQVLAEYAEQLMAVLGAHPHVVGSVLTTPVRSESELGVYEHVAATLADSGIEPALCRQITFAAESVVFGAVAMANAGYLDPSEEQRIRFPALRRLTAESRPPTQEENFAVAFGAFLAGLDSIVSGADGTLRAS